MEYFGKHILGGKHSGVNNNLLNRIFVSIKHSRNVIVCMMDNNAVITFSGNTAYIYLLFVIIILLLILLVLVKRLWMNLFVKYINIHGVS